MAAYTPRTGAKCGCKRGVQRDNCPNCEGTGMVIDFQAIRARGGEDMTHTAKHTPGPWTLERDRAKSLSIYASSTFVGEVYNEVDEPSAQENANAHLIAAAPAMYEALKQTFNVMGNILTDSQLDTRTPCGLTIREWESKVRIALAQAEGGQ